MPFSLVSLVDIACCRWWQSMMCHRQTHPGNYPRLNLWVVLLLVASASVRAVFSCVPLPLFLHLWGAVCHRRVRSWGPAVMRCNNTSFQLGEVSKHSDPPPTPSLKSYDELCHQQEESEEGTSQGAGSPGPEVCVHGLHSAWVVSRHFVLGEGHLSWCGVAWWLILAFDEWTGDASLVSLGAFWNSSVFHHCLHRGISNVSWICAQSICLYSFERGHVGSGIGQWIWPFSFSSRACLGVRGPENRNQMMKTTFQSSCQLVVGLYGSQGVQPQRGIQVLESLESYVLQCVISKEYYQNSPRTHWESPG